MDTVLRQGLLGLAALLALGAALASAAGPDGVGLALGVAAYVALAASVVARSPRLGSLLAAVGAFSANAYLFSHKWEAAKGAQSICNINAHIDCDRVNASEWSTVGGIPITLLGMGFYARNTEYATLTIAKIRFSWWKRRASSSRTSDAMARPA